MAAITVAQIVVDCPHCGEPLPSIPIVGRAGRIQHDSPRGQFTVKLDASLNPEWWQQVGEQHGNCTLT